MESESPACTFGHVLECLEQAVLLEHLHHLVLENLAPDGGNVVDLLPDYFFLLPSNASGTLPLGAALTVDSPTHRCLDEDGLAGDDEAVDLGKGLQCLLAHQRDAMEDASEVEEAGGGGVKPQQFLTTI